MGKAHMSSCYCRGLLVNAVQCCLIRWSLVGANMQSKRNANKSSCSFFIWWIFSYHFPPCRCTSSITTNNQRLVSLVSSAAVGSRRKQETLSSGQKKEKLLSCLRFGRKRFQPVQNFKTCIFRLEEHHFDSFFSSHLRHRRQLLFTSCSHKKNTSRLIYTTTNNKKVMEVLTEKYDDNNNPNTVDVGKELMKSYEVNGRRKKENRMLID